MRSSHALLLTSFFALTSLHSSQAYAQNTSDSDPVVRALTQHVDLFFENLDSANVAAKDAFAELLADGPLANRSEQLAAFVEAYEKIEPTHGRFLSAKQVAAKRVGDDVMFLTFLYKTEKFPIVWRFAFYRPPLESADRPDWFVVRLSFDTKIESLAN